VEAAASMHHKFAASLAVIVAALWCGGCARPAAKLYKLPSGKQINITGIGPMSFPQGGDALVMNCETDISIDDIAALRKQADEIWEIFRKDVENAGMKNGVIRMVHNEGSGLITTGKGYGFVFQKDIDGKWHCLADEKTKPTDQKTKK
jgi:hypothetical protein